MIVCVAWKSAQIFIPYCRNARVLQIDRHTDGQTDRILMARPRLHLMQRGKNKVKNPLKVKNHDYQLLKFGD